METTMSDTLDLSSMRVDYDRGRLHREDLRPDPIAQFKQWLDDARDANILEPNAMSLATVCGDCARPSIRTVLLKGCDARGFLFFTNHESRKAQEIDGNPRVALLFPWLA